MTIAPDKKSERHAAATQPDTSGLAVSDPSERLRASTPKPPRYGPARYRNRPSGENTALSMNGYRVAPSRGRQRGIASLAARQPRAPLSRVSPPSFVRRRNTVTLVRSSPTPKHVDVSPIGRNNHS